jgi:ribonuclease R
MRNIILDDNLTPIKIVCEEAEDAHDLIEEFMLLANRTVGKFIKMQKRPTLNRIHEKPSPDKIEELKSILQFFGYKLNTTSDVDVKKQINDILKHSKDKPEFSALQNYIIRTMSKAKYSTEHIGHYGLGFEDYAHFTSPIRRYSDVVVHRVLNSILKGQKSTEQKNMDRLSIHLSMTETASSQAERESRKFKEAQYIEKFIGQNFEAVVISIESFGVFVELNNLGCQGLIHKSILDQYNITIDPSKMRFSKGKKHYSLGDKVYVEVLNVNLMSKNINYAWYEK